MGAHPKGKGSDVVEVVLHRTPNGYKGEKGKLNNEGTKIEIAIHDHDETAGTTDEEMKMSPTVSAGKATRRLKSPPVPSSTWCARSEDKRLGGSWVRAPGETKPVRDVRGSPPRAAA